MKQLAIMVFYCAMYGIVGYWIGEKSGEQVGAYKLLQQQKDHPPPLPLMYTRHAPVVMRDARVICLSAILSKTPRENWKELTNALAMSPNVCLVAEFLYPKVDIPERSPEPETQFAVKAIDNG